MRRQWMLVALTMLTALPVTAQAQQAEFRTADSPMSVAERLSQPMNPVLIPSALDARAETAPALLAPSSQSRALMIAGAALFVAGILTGGDAGAVLMLGGAGIGAYGVYQHFR